MKKITILIIILSFCALLPLACSKPATEDYLPLRVGNSWTYRAVIADRSEPVKMELKVTKAEKMDNHECMVMELFLDDRSESSQKEYYARTQDGLVIVKRIYPKDEVELRPPELMMKSPAQVGQSWKWSGTIKELKADFSFNVEKSEKIEAMSRVFDCIKYVITGTLGSDEKVSTERWFARNVGMVRETTSIKQGTKEVKVTATLESYDTGQKTGVPPEKN
jgi:hypothetical protein